MLADNMMPLIRQNIINRKASGYADADLVLKHYTRFRQLQHEVEQLRHKRNQHAQLAKQIATIADDD
jgi:seryl-tRNA synthetase